MCLLLTRKPRCAYAERDTHRSSCNLISLPILLQVEFLMRDHLGRYRCHCAGGVPCICFLLSFGPSPSNTWEKQENRTRGTMQLYSGSLFCRDESFPKHLSPIPTLGYYLSILQHTFKVLLIPSQFSFLVQLIRFIIHSFDRKYV